MLGSRRARLAAAFASIYLIWGSTYLAIRIGLETLPPLLMAGSRFLVAGGLLYLWSRLDDAPRPRPVEWRSAALVGGLLLLGGNGLVTLAERSVPSGLTAVLVGMVPVWMTALDALFFRGPRPGLATHAGLVAGIAGIALLVWPGASAVAAVDPLGAVLLLIAGLSWATGSLMGRRLELPRRLSLASGMEMLAGGALLVAVALLRGEAAELEMSRVSARSLLAWSYLVAFGSIVGVSAYLWLLRETSASAVSSYALVNPVVAVLLGWALGGEPVTQRSLAATTLILGAVGLLLAPKPAPAAPVLELRPRAAER